MPYALLYHPVPLNVQRRIARALEARLATAPEQYGEPLRGTLRGYWKLRVGDYRVIYKVVRAEVWIFGIRHRKQIYHDVVRRLRPPLSEGPDAPGADR